MSSSVSVIVTETSVEPPGGNRDRAVARNFGIQHVRGLGHEITAGAVRIDSARLRTFRLNGSINSIGLVRIGHVHNGEIEVINTCFLRVIAEFKLCPAAFGGDIRHRRSLLHGCSQSPRPDNGGNR